jgi:hypothetical protein
LCRSNGINVNINTGISGIELYVQSTFHRTGFVYVVLISIVRKVQIIYFTGTVLCKTIIESETWHCLLLGNAFDTVITGASNFS